MNLYDKACQFAKYVLCDFEHGVSTIIATKQEIEDADGRRGRNQISDKGSYVYAAYDTSEYLLYVGETGVSIKNRFITDGSGAHKEKPWYQNMEIVRFKRLDSDGEEYTDREEYRNLRKLLEKALILEGKPRCQN